MHGQGDQAGRLEELRRLFERRGLMGRRLEVELEGSRYVLRLDGEAFSVHRLNPNRGLPPGGPGWLVCCLDGRGLYQECASPDLAACALTEEKTLEDWLAVARRLASQHKEH